MIITAIYTWSSRFGDLSLIWFRNNLSYELKCRCNECRYKRGFAVTRNIIGNAAYASKQQTSFSIIFFKNPDISEAVEDYSYIDYLPCCTGYFNVAICSILDGRPSLVYQGAKACGGEESRNTCTACPDPLGQCALRISRKGFKDVLSNLYYKK